MVTPVNNRGGDEGRQGRRANQEERRQGARLSESELKMKLASMPYSFSQQMPAPSTQSKSAFNKAYPKVGAPKTGHSSWPSTSANGAQAAAPARENGYWGSGAAKLAGKRPTTAAEIVASNPQEQHKDAEIDTKSMSERAQLELLSKLVPTTSVVPKVPGRFANSENVLRSSGRTGSALPVTLRTNPVPLSSVQSAPPNTRLQSLSSSSASVERARKKLSAAAAAAAASEPTGGNSLTLVDSGRMDMAKGSSPELKNTADRDQKAAKKIDGVKDEQEFTSEQPSAGRSMGSSNSFSNPRPQARTSAPPRSTQKTLFDAKRNPRRQSPPPLAPKRMGGSPSRASSSSSPSVDQNTSGASRLSQISVLRKSGNPTSQPAHSSKRGNAPASAPPGFGGRALSSAFFPQSQSRKPGPTRSPTSHTSHSGAPPSNTRDRVHSPPVRPPNKRADAFREALSIAPKNFAQGSENYGASLKRNQRQPSNQRPVENVQRNKFFFEERGRLNGTSGTKSLEKIGDERREVFSKRNNSLPSKNVANGLSHKADAMCIPTASRKLDAIRKPGAVSKPPVTHGGGTQDEPRLRGADGAQESGHDLSDMGGLASNKVVDKGPGNPSENSVGHAAEDVDVLPPLPDSTDNDQFESMLRQLGWMDPEEEREGSEGNRFQAERQPSRYYSHF